MALALVGVVKVMQIGIARAEAAKVTRLIGPSPKCGNRILLILWFGARAGGTS